MFKILMDSLEFSLVGLFSGFGDDVPSGLLMVDRLLFSDE
jgi:hypothetical protein